MNLLRLPWLELAILTSALGAIGVAILASQRHGFALRLVFSVGSLTCVLLAWLAHYAGADAQVQLSLQRMLINRELFRVDDLNAPLLVSVALLHFLTSFATSRAHVRRFSSSWTLAEEALRLATFSSRDPWMLIALLTIKTIPPYVELVNRRRAAGVYMVHMVLFVVLLIGGWTVVSLAPSPSSLQGTLGIILLTAAILVRCGTIPAHCWVTDWFEHASLGIAVLYVVPLSGAYAAIRLVLPIAPEWVLRSIGLISLATAVYAAGMATIQKDARRFFAFLFLSHSSLVLVGLELETVMSLTASLCLWISVILSLGGFGLALRALEARFGRLSLTSFHGLYEHTPTLAICFLLTGLACVGFPATIGFVATELLVDSAIHESSLIGVVVVAAAALNGIAVVRAYLLLFTGGRHLSTVGLRMTLRERIAILTLALLVLGGGIWPQPAISSRYRVANQILKQRREAGLLESVTTPSLSRSVHSLPYPNTTAPEAILPNTSFGE